MLNALGNIGDFVGGIGVLITLAYLAIQVRQHTAALHTASRQGLSEGYRSHNGRLLDMQVSEFFALGLRDYPDLPPAEKRTFSYTINDHALFLHTAFALYESGSLGMDNYLPYLTWFACQVATPGGSAWWREARSFYNAALVKSVDARLAEGNLPDVLGLGFYQLEAHERAGTFSTPPAV